MKNSTFTAARAWVIAATMVAATAPIAGAHGYEVAGPAAVRVWVDGGDVFPSYRDVTISLRAERDCYATLFLVDTSGYLHVLYPSSPTDAAWVCAGRTYQYSACDVGLDRFDGVGVAHLFAVGSPVPFDFSYYGPALFTASFGFRIVGDPFVACRDFYVSLLPAQCRWDFVGVSCARFYVHQWVRYPAYLCYGDGVHVRVGDNCRDARISMLRTGTTPPIHTT